MDERKYELINELYLATVNGNEQAMIDLACELYESYGWYGEPYPC